MATVIWNQLAFPLESDIWTPYNTNYISVTFNSGIATITYKSGTAGDNSAIRQTDGHGFPSDIGELFYVSVMMNPSFNTTFFMELSGTTDRADRVTAPANTWTRYAKVALPATDRARTDARAYIEIYNSSSANDTEQIKSPIIISLTKMYGAGNEPTAAEFERQCALNGIDLTKYHPRDTGTPRHWITTENKRLQTARSGNTVDSEDIAHFVTNCAMPLRSCQIEIEPSLAGYDSIELDYRGRNLLINIATPGNSIFTLNSDGSVSANGTVTGESWFIWNSSVTGTRSSSTQYVQTRLLPNGRYFLAKDCYVDANHQSNTYPRYSLDLSNYDGTNERKGTHCTVDSEGCMVVDDTYKYNWMRIYESKANTYSNYTFYPQIYLASEPNRTWEPCNWRKFTVNFDNKIYGGTLDLVSGKLTTEWVKQTFDGTETWEAEGTKLYRTYISGLANTDKDDTSSVVSSYLSSVTRTALYPGTATDGICLMNGDRVLVRMQSAVATLGEWKDYITAHPMQIIYKLATPLTYQLTPQEITTLLGVNNVWCNDGKVTLQYYANSPTQDSTDMFERRRRMFAINSSYPWGIKLYKNNTAYIGGNSTVDSYFTDNNFFIAGPFDTGSTDSKTYTISRNPVSTVNGGAALKLYNDLTAKSVDYWGITSSKGTSYTFTSAGRYVFFSVCKAYASTSYMYYTVDGVNHYLFKGAGVP